MTGFLVIGAVGIVLLLFSLVVGEHLHGIFDALGGGDWFTGSSMAAFLGALGFGGAIVKQLTGSTLLAVVGGVVLGVVFGALVAYGMLTLRRNDTGGAVTTNDLMDAPGVVSYTHLRAHETPEHLVCRLLLEKKKKQKKKTNKKKKKRKKKKNTKINNKKK